MIRLVVENLAVNVCDDLVLERVGLNPLSKLGCLPVSRQKHSDRRQKMLELQRRR